MNMKSQLAPVATAVVITLGAVSATEAADNPFAAQAFERGYQVAAEMRSGILNLQKKLGADPANRGRLARARAEVHRLDMTVFRRIIGVGPR